MGLDDFMDVLGKLNRLTECQRRAVAEAMAEATLVDAIAAQSKPASQKKKMYRKKDREHFENAAKSWPLWTESVRSQYVTGLAVQLDRTEKAIRYQITSRLK